MPAFGHITTQMPPTTDMRSVGEFDTMEHGLNALVVPQELFQVRDFAACSQPGREILCERR